MSAPSRPFPWGIFAGRTPILVIVCPKSIFLGPIFLSVDVDRSQSIFYFIQSGASSLAKHGGAYFSAVYGSIQDPIAAPGPYETQEP